MGPYPSFRGIVPAMPVPFRTDYSIDEDELRRLAQWLAGHPGIGGLVTNGHTGEVFSLRPEERARVTRVVGDAVGGRLPVISGVCAESPAEAADHAVAAKEAGAVGLLVMPAHHWLRFGMEPEHVIEHFTRVGEAAQVSLVVHVYPAWTKANYPPSLLAELVRLPWVTAVKIGTREMSQYDRDLRAIREADPDCSILTCHDEYLLPTMVQGVDGALVGFASFIPEMIVELYEAVCDGDLKRARQIHFRIYPLKEAVYGRDEPSGAAHARLKTAMWLSGRLNSNRMRPPIRPPRGEALERIAGALRAAGLLQKAPEAGT